MHAILACITQYGALTRRLVPLNALSADTGSIQSQIPVRTCPLRIFTLEGRMHLETLNSRLYMAPGSSPTSWFGKCYSKFVCIDWNNGLHRWECTLNVFLLYAAALPLHQGSPTMTRNDPDSRPRPCPRPVGRAFGSPVALRVLRGVGWSCGAVRNQVRSCSPNSSLDLVVHLWHGVTLVSAVGVTPIWPARRRHSTRLTG